MSDNSLRELFPPSERIAIGGSDPRGTNTFKPECPNSLWEVILRDLLGSLYRLCNQRRFCYTLQALRR